MYLRVHTCIARNHLPGCAGETAGYCHGFDLCTFIHIDSLSLDVCLPVYLSVCLPIFCFSKMRFIIVKGHVLG